MVSRFAACWFDGRSSRAHQVTVTVEKGRLSVVEQGRVRGDFDVAQVQVTPALGSTRRTLRLPDGGRVDTVDTMGAEIVAALEAEAGHNLGQRFVHLLERRWRWAFACTLFMVVFAWWGAVCGLPWAAEKAAFALPQSAMKSLGDGVLEELDEGFLDPSQLDSWRREELAEKYRNFAVKTGTAGRHRLVFRSFWGGPNAFALPSGVIVMTDEMVEFAESDEELLGVIAHEIAHLERRHSLRQVIQSSSVFFMVSLLSGDFTASLSLAGALPTVLVEARYSRQFEEEADEIATRYMRRAEVDVEAMARLMERIKEMQGDVPELFSTHPDSEKRAQRFEEAALEQDGPKADGREPADREPTDE